MRDHKASGGGSDEQIVDLLLLLDQVLSDSARKSPFAASPRYDKRLHIFFS